jgi:hypothetical protein
MGVRGAARRCPLRGAGLWLARLLHSRGFPLDRLAHDLRIAADVVVDAASSAPRP